MDTIFKRVAELSHAESRPEDGPHRAKIYGHSIGDGLLDIPKELPFGFGVDPAGIRRIL